jgi:hypothetical protein
MLAMFLATGLTGESKETADNQNRPLYLSLSERLDEADKSGIGRFFHPSEPVTVPGLMWQVEDYEIKRTSGIMR